jgi:hypothetical protein
VVHLRCSICSRSHIPKDITPRATLEDVGVSQDITRLHISIRAAEQIGRGGGKQQPRHLHLQRRKLPTNQSRGNRSCCRSSELFRQVRELLTVSLILPFLPSFVEQQSLYLLPFKPLQAAGSEHHHVKPLTIGFFFLPTFLLIHLSQYDNHGSRSTHLGNEPAVQARDAQSARRPDDASKQED